MNGSPSVHCTGCRYYRPPVSVRPFSAADLSSAAGLKAQAAWEQEQRQRNLNEIERLSSSQPFPYRPQFYAFCEYATPSDEAVDAAKSDAAARAELLGTGRATVDPVTGTINRMYVLCAVKNRAEDCGDFEPA
jgi:hypothetical protein